MMRFELFTVCVFVHRVKVDLLAQLDLQYVMSETPHIMSVTFLKPL